MKKILVLTPRFPYPVIGGDRLRIYKMCVALSQRYELTLLSICESQDEMKYEVNDSVFSSIYRVYLPKYRSFINTIAAIPTFKPLQVAYYQSNQFEKKIKELLPGVDATLSHLIRTGDYVKALPGIHFLEMTDAISLNYRRVCELGNVVSVRGLIYKLEQKRLESYEKKIANSFNLVSFVSENDRDYLYPDGPANIKVYSNGVDTNLLKFKRRTITVGGDVVFIFIGNMYSLQNMDAIRWFIKDFLMPLNKNINRFRLKVVGKIKENDRVNLNSIPGVFATGTVENINEATSDGHIGICPMRLGAGIQNKILEYMSLGLPCITTSMSFPAIKAEVDKDILIADIIDTFKVHCDKLINDKVFYDTMASNARKFVTNTYSWDAKLEPFLTDIEKILGN